METHDAYIYIFLKQIQKKKEKKGEHLTLVKKVLL